MKASGDLQLLIFVVLIFQKKDLKKFAGETQSLTMCRTELKRTGDTGDRRNGLNR
jgi:hypothetical protein